MPRDFVADVNNNMQALFVELADYVPDGRVRQFGPITAISVGVRSPIYNRIFVLDRPPTEKLRAAVSWLLDREGPFWVTIPESIAETVRESAPEFDFGSPDQYEHGMVLGALDAFTPGKPEVDFSDVTDEEGLEDFIWVVATTYDIPYDAVERVTPSALLDDESMGFFVGYVDGEPITAGRLLVTDDIAGVYAINVVEEYRSQGIGEAMTRKVLRGGYEADCEVAVLQAPDMSYRLYERMGFESVVTYQQLQPERRE